MIFNYLNNDNIFGVINYLGLYPSDLKKCECNISEDISLFEAYICIKGKIYKDCAKAVKKMDLSNGIQ
jgi:uncharacterized membrane protein